MDLGLKGKVALVTGAAHGIGATIVKALSDEGAMVAVNYLSSVREAEALVEDIKRRNRVARAYEADVAEYDAVAAMVDQIIADFGHIDVLVNNAGFVQRQPFLHTVPSDWHRQIDVGLYGVMNCIHLVAPHMVPHGGRIINLAGDSARVGESGLSVTAASRGAVISLTKSLAREFGKHSICVNAVAIGLVDTRHLDKAWLSANFKKIIRNYPIGRIGEPTDVAPMVTFLASENAAWMTGQVISVNGGFSMG